AQQRSGHPVTPRATASATPVPGVTPPGAIDALSRMRRTVDEGLAVSEVRADVAVDLDNLIGNLQAEIAAGVYVDVDQRVRELRQKIVQRVREGGLTQNRADALTRTLTAL
ncbi:hypothetical protein, partial [Actinoallomurus acaciae]